MTDEHSNIGPEAGPEAGPETSPEAAPDAGLDAGRAKSLAPGGAAADLAAQHSRFLQFLRRRVEDAATAEDILQGAYVKAMERGAQLRETENSVAWFYRILRNAVTDHYRRQAVRSRALEEWAAAWQQEQVPEQAPEICACIQEAVRGLKPEYRTAIEQVDLGGASVAAFAQSERATANAASVRLHRARKAVARQLMAICGTCATHKCLDCTCKH